MFLGPKLGGFRAPWSIKRTPESKCKMRRRALIGTTKTQLQ